VFAPFVIVLTCHLKLYVRVYEVPSAVNAVSSPFV